MPPPVAHRSFPWKPFAILWLIILVAAGVLVVVQYRSYRRERVHRVQTILRKFSDLTTSKPGEPAQTPAQGSAVTATPSEEKPAETPMMIFPLKENAKLFVQAELTEGGETKKLPGLVVYVYPEEDIRTYLQGRKAESKRAQEQLAPEVQAAKVVQVQAEAKTRTAYELMVSAIDDKPKREVYQRAWEQALNASTEAKKKAGLLGLKFHSYDWGSFYFEGVSSPTKLEMPPGYGVMAELPAGRYVLGAATEHVPKSEKESHYWMVKVVLKAGEEKYVKLSNANLTTSGSEESILLTSEPQLPSTLN